MPKRVVIVDDEPEVAGLLKELAESEGFEAYTAANGEEGLAAVERYGPDGVFTDFNMPVLDGLGMAKRLRELGYRKPVFMMTSDAQRDPEGRIYFTGSLLDKLGQYGIGEADIPTYVNGFFPKPLDLQEIRAALASIPATPEQ
ncbi:MAG: response regulator [Candidatus Aenigmarchaeota archaeon]|nr:response regulator [Candidatus Aenigmarchaeota archaeon]